MESKPEKNEQKKGYDSFEDALKKILNASNEEVEKAINEDATPQKMKERYEKLKVLLEKMPKYNTDYDLNILEEIASEYGRILREVRNISPDYESNTQHYFSELTDIESKIHIARYGKSQNQKDLAVGDAKRWLSDDIDALAGLIKITEKFE